MENPKGMKLLKCVLCIHDPNTCGGKKNCDFRDAMKEVKGGRRENNSPVEKTAAESGIQVESGLPEGRK